MEIDRAAPCSPTMAEAGSSSSSLTSTSHTLTQAPGMSSLAAALAGHGSPTRAFLDSICAEHRHAFFRPDPSVLAGSLQVAKQNLDALAGRVSDEQQRRLREAGKKRKREGGLRTDVLKIRKLHTEGFETGQIWQQAKRIISCTLDQSDVLLRELEDTHDVEPDQKNAVYGEGNKTAAGTVSEDRAESDEESASATSEMVSGSAPSDENEDAEDGDSLPTEDDEEGVNDEAEDGETSEDGSEDEDIDMEKLSGGFVQDPNGLNDGFFSIDEFNKQSQWYEDQDARADPNTDQVSEDEEVDWHNDPMTAPKVKSKPESKKEKKPGLKKGTGLEDETNESAEDDEDEGPTFGDMNLYAPEGASDDEDEDSAKNELDLTANDIYYKDFFAPPAWKSKNADRRNGSPSQPVSRPDEAEVERAMDLVKRDLFDDEAGELDSEDALSDVSTGDVKSRRSAHERRQVKLAEEIRKLEGELVAKRAWTLSGEAAAVDRPVNSLLEEDLDFEHAGKPIPIVTEEVSESIENLIKKRILDQEFDEVVRRRPDALSTTHTRRSLVDVDDSKPKQSLAELYEEEHVKKANPDTYVSKSDEKMRAEEKEIEQMWKEVSGRLDALSSWSFKPKPAAPTLTVVSDVARISMEDAQPAAAQGVGGAGSMLAPQEIYRAGNESAEKGEIVAKSGLPVAKGEMTREEKLRRRRRQKERQRKSRGLGAKDAPSKKAQVQMDTMKNLKKGGVTVINRKGEMVGLDGQAVGGPKAPTSAGSFKL